MHVTNDTMRAIWDLLEADAWRAQLWSRFPDMPIDHAESIIEACRSEDRGRGQHAFKVALEAYALRRAA